MVFGYLSPWTLRVGLYHGFAAVRAGRRFRAQDLGEYSTNVAVRPCGEPQCAPYPVLLLRNSNAIVMIRNSH